MTESTPSPFSTRTVAIMLALAIFSFGAVMVLVGWSPELRDKDQAGAHPYSTSAIGYAGAVRLLERQGLPVQVSRLKRNLSDRQNGLLILTPTSWGMRSDQLDTDFVTPTLLVLPKWDGLTDPANHSRQKDTRFISALRINDGLRELDIDAELGRIDTPNLVTSPFGEFTVRPDVKLQILVSEELDAIVPAGDGVLLGYHPIRNLYVLSDPDLLNTFGLSRFDNARFTTETVQYLRTYDWEPILFDATLHGFDRSENLLQMVFDIPFVGATAIALAAAALLGWAALIRFGPPSRETRAIALGKQALAESSAGLVSMTRRETQMAPGYLQVIRKRVLREIAAPKSLSESELSTLLDRLGPEETSGLRFSQIASNMQSAANGRDDLVDKARNLFRWRADILRRTSDESR